MAGLRACTCETSEAKRRMSAKSLKSPTKPCTWLLPVSDFTLSTAFAALTGSLPGVSNMHGRCSKATDTKRRQDKQLEKLRDLTSLEVARCRCMH